MLDAGFSRLLAGNLAYRRDGILLSGGGNHLIAATGVLPREAIGETVPPDSRLLLNPDEWGPPSWRAGRCVSDSGRATFASHLASQSGDVVALRDADVNKGVPLFCNTYAYPMPRRAPASQLFHMGPWLYPALVAYQIPAQDWLAVATELVDRLAALSRSVSTISIGPTTGTSTPSTRARR